MDLQFVVDAYSWKRKAGKLPVYKVSLKSKDGDSLTLSRGDSSIFEDFPKGETFDVKISKGQSNLEEFTGE